jgi:hypothetical protein
MLLHAGYRPAVKADIRRMAVGRTDNLRHSKISDKPKPDPITVPLA